MTAEKKILISPKDILAIGFECPHCGASYSVPIQKHDRPTTLCPNCNEKILDADGESATVGTFVGRLKLMQTNKYGKAIRFEIACESKPDAKA
jgi:uncharacterized paraquat-inducible protein A